MKDFSKLYLSAVTAKIRTHWIRAILQAANLKSEEKGLEAPLPPSPPLARTAISRVKERARTRSRFRSPEIQDYLADSDEGATDHSSSSLPAEKKLEKVFTKKRSFPVFV